MNDKNIILVSHDWPPAKCGIAVFSEKLAEMIEKFKKIKVRKLTYEKLNKIKISQKEKLLLIFRGDHISQTEIKQLKKVLNKKSFIALIIDDEKAPIEFIKFLSSKSEKLFTFKEEISKKYLNAKLVTCGATIEARKIKNTRYIPKEFVYFGFINKDKGLENLIKSFEGLKNKDINLNIFGSVHKNQNLQVAEYIKKITKLAKKYNNKKVNVFFSFFDSKYLDKILKRNVCIILPFKNGLSCKSSTFFSSLSYGLPVITTYKKELLKEIKKCPGVFISKSTRPLDLLMQIRKVSTSTIEKQKIRNYYKKNFSWRKIVDSLLA